MLHLGQVDLGHSSDRGFVLPPLPLVAPTAFQLPSQQEPEVDAVSTSSSDSSSEVEGFRQQTRGRARAQRAASSSSTASSQTSSRTSRAGGDRSLTEAILPALRSDDHAARSATDPTSAQDPSTSPGMVRLPCLSSHSPVFSGSLLCEAASLSLQMHINSCSGIAGSR